MDISKINFNPEFSFKTSRSSGKGGQNVNKVSSKVELNFDVLNSILLNPTQKDILFKKLNKRINKEGILQLIIQSERSQLLNKQIAIKKFYELLAKSFIQKKKRIATKLSAAVKAKRLKKKKMKSEKKELRKKFHKLIP